MASTAHPELTHINGLRLNIATCYWQFAGCNGAGGYVIMTSEVTERACSRCAEIERLSNPDTSLVMAVVG